VPNRFISSETIGAAVEKLLADPSYGERVKALAEWADTHDAAQAAADEIMAFTATKVA
jgi:UDP:flavonoid glycosyltransferase YjiC (YdhE family)